MNTKASRGEYEVSVIDSMSKATVDKADVVRESRSANSKKKCNY